MDFGAWLKGVGAEVEGVLDRVLPAEAPALPERDLRACMRYSVFAGGKRLRPALVMAGWQLAGGGSGAERACALRVAAAVEMVHTYSLMQDDLPCMDNDTLRRGRPTAHVAYNEATALLASDGLQTGAFGLLASEATHPDAEVRCALVGLLAAAAGAEGMVAGQQIDMDYEWKNASGEGALRSVDDLTRLQALKTGAMITAAARMGAWAGSGGPGFDDVLVRYGHHAGLAFQMMDDVLDATADSAQLGKTAGKDAAAGKATFVTLLGVEAARAGAQDHMEKALRALVSCDAAARGPLEGLARAMVMRAA